MVFEVGVCTQTNSEAILMSFLLLILFILVMISIVKRQVWLGIISSTGMLFLSLFIVGCIAIFGYLIAGFSLVSIVAFVTMKPSSI